MDGFRHGYTEDGNELKCNVRAVLLPQPRKNLNIWLLVRGGVIQGHPKSTISRFCVIEASQGPLLALRLVEGALDCSLWNF